MTTPPPLPAVLFDYNGVLVDDEEVHLAAFQSVVVPLGYSVSREAYWETYLGFDDYGAFDAILRAAGNQPSEAEIRRLVEQKKPVYQELAAAGLKTFPGAAELVRALAQRSLVGIVSGALRDEIELGLRVLGAEGSVSLIVAAEDTSRSKPDPEGYRLGIEGIAARLGAIEPAEIVAIEDSLAGVESAKGAGLCCVAVCHSYSREQLEQSGADYVVERIADITPELLAQASHHEVGRA